MLTRLGGNPEQLRALDRIRDWTRARFALSDGATVMAAEISCKVPGCPPVETVVAFWDDATMRYRFKVFKPAAAVDENDLPLAWLKPSLVDYGELGCECC